MKKISALGMALAVCFSIEAFSSAVDTATKAPEVRALEMLKNIILDNDAFMRVHTTPYGDIKDTSYFEGQTHQNPRATVLACSDSRFHEGAIDLTPFGDDFVIRNIGNQFGVGQGSTEYGVGGIETPLLLIIGHDKCGAVTAATLGIKGVSPGPLRTELELMRESLGLEGEGEVFNAHPKLTAEQEVAVQKNIIKNIHKQVNLACEKFADRIKDQKLLIVGALYDFLGERKKGQYGKLVIVNINNVPVVDNPDGKSWDDTAMKKALESIVDRNKGVVSVAELLG